MGQSGGKIGKNRKKCGNLGFKNRDVSCPNWSFYFYTPNTSRRFLLLNAKLTVDVGDEFTSTEVENIGDSSRNSRKTAARELSAHPLF